MEFDPLQDSLSCDLLSLFLSLEVLNNMGLVLSALFISCDLLSNYLVA